MTIWILAVLLIASVAALGFRQGAVRVAFSLIGIIVGAIVAVPLGHLVSKLLGVVGVKDPFLLWVLGPIIAFVIVSIIFKTAAAPVHHKIDVHYRYHAGDLRTALWERLNHRLGLCLGVVNGVAYLILISFPIYFGSYVTGQLASSDQDPKWMRVLNLLGRDLHATGLAKVGRAIDHVSQVDYEMADLGALIYRNPLLAARLRSYPGFLGLSELPEFQAMATDKEFQESWQRQDPAPTVMEKQSVATIRSNPDLEKQIWQTVEPDLADLRTYLTTGRSPKYDPIKILGRWQFDVRAAVSAMRRAKPNMSASEMQRRRGELEAALSKTAMVARPDSQVTIKNAPQLGAGVPTAPGQQTLQGQWKDVGNKYVLSFSGQDLSTTVEGDRLTIKNPGMDLVFNRED